MHAAWPNPSFEGIPSFEPLLSFASGNVLRQLRPRVRGSTVQADLEAVELIEASRERASTRLVRRDLIVSTVDCLRLPRDRHSTCALRRLVAYRIPVPLSRPSFITYAFTSRGAGSRSGSGSRSRRSSCSCRCSSSFRRASRRSSSRPASCWRHAGEPSWPVAPGADGDHPRLERLARARRGPRFGCGGAAHRPTGALHWPILRWPPARRAVHVRSRELSLHRAAALGVSIRPHLPAVRPGSILVDLALAAARAPRRPMRPTPIVRMPSCSRCRCSA